MGGTPGKKNHVRMIVNGVYNSSCILPTCCFDAVLDLHSRKLMFTILLCNANKTNVIFSVTRLYQETHNIPLGILVGVTALISYFSVKLLYDKQFIDLFRCNHIEEKIV